MTDADVIRKALSDLCDGASAHVIEQGLAMAPVNAAYSEALAALNRLAAEYEAAIAALRVAREFVADKDWGEHAFLWQTQTIGVIDAALVGPERTIVTNQPEDWPADTFRERRR